MVEDPRKSPIAQRPTNEVLNLARGIAVELAKQGMTTDAAAKYIASSLTKKVVDATHLPAIEEKKAESAVNGVDISKPLPGKALTTREEALQNLDKLVSEEEKSNALKQNAQEKSLLLIALKEAQKNVQEIEKEERQKEAKLSISERILREFEVAKEKISTGLKKEGIFDKVKKGLDEIVDLFFDTVVPYRKALDQALGIGGNGQEPATGAQKTNAATAVSPSQGQEEVKSKDTVLAPQPQLTPSSTPAASRVEIEQARNQAAINNGRQPG